MAQRRERTHRARAAQPLSRVELIRMHGSTLPGFRGMTLAEATALFDEHWAEIRDREAGDPDIRTRAVCKKLLEDFGR
jgi:hypothetical protein